MDRSNIRDLSAELEWAKVGLLTPATYPAAAAAAGRGEVAGLDAPLVARLIEAYEDAKTARGVIDFEDVLLLTTAMLREREDVARQVRPRYRWFTVDEYQDVSAAQQLLLDAWVGERDDVCVVGDPHQTIYTFAGADSSLLGGFAAAHPGATVVHLVRNYRSRPAVVELGNGVLARPRTGAEPRLRAVRPSDRRRGRARPRAADVRGARGRPRRGRRRAARVAALLAEGTPARDVAVLVRTNGQLEVLEEALGSGACRTWSAAGSGSSPGARCARPSSCCAAPPRPPRRPTAPVAATGDVLGLADRGRRRPVGCGLVAASRRRAGGRSGTAGSRWPRSSTTPGGSRRSTRRRPVDLVADLETRAAQQHAPVLEGVTLATMHAAKGLEWDVVLLPGLSDGPGPDLARGDPGRGGGGASAAVRRGHPRPRGRRTCRGRAPATPGARGARRPSRFLDAVRPGGAGRPVPVRAGGAGRGGRRGQPAAAVATGGPRCPASAGAAASR